MLENGPLSSRESENNRKLDIFGNPIKKRDAKALQSPSLIDQDIWEKISDVKSSHSNQNGMSLLDNITNQNKDKHSYLYSCDNSILADMENHKQKVDDNISVSSSHKFSDILVNNEPKSNLKQKPGGFLTNCNHNFEALSNHDKADISDIKSVSSFSSDNKLCGAKRKIQ